MSQGVKRWENFGHRRTPANGCRRPGRVLRCAHAPVIALQSLALEEPPEGRRRAPSRKRSELRLVWVRSPPPPLRRCGREADCSGLLTRRPSSEGPEVRILPSPLVMLDESVLFMELGRGPACSARRTPRTMCQHSRGTCLARVEPLDTRGQEGVGKRLCPHAPTPSLGSSAP